MHASDKNIIHDAGGSSVLLLSSGAFHLIASFPRMQLVENITFWFSANACLESVFKPPLYPDHDQSL